MQAIVDLTNERTSGTFKFQYSLRVPVHKHSEFIPKDKKLAEGIIGSFYCGFAKRYF